MRFFLIHDSFTELPDWPATLPEQGFLWVTCSRRVFEVQLERAQQHLQRLAGGGLVDLHVADLLNPQLPSQYDYTSWYDLLVFRRLAAGQGTERMFLDEEHGTASSASQAVRMRCTVSGSLLVKRQISWPSSSSRDQPTNSQ